jgi:O-antigen ligase
MALAALLVTGGAWAVAGGVLPAGVSASLEGPLTRHRIELWRDALALARGDAALGVGPGRFEELSQAVAAAPLSDGKPHSAPLQQAAEQGVVGLLLLAAVFCWMLYTLWRTARPTPVALTAGAALTGVAAICAVGNALSFTAVTAGAGLLAGLATARPLTREPSRAAGLP